MTAATNQHRHAGAPQRLMAEVYRYAERLYLSSHLFSAGIMIAGAMLLLHLTRMMSRPATASLVLVLLLATLIAYLVRCWLAQRRRLSIFTLRPGPRGRTWHVARRRGADPFYAVPAKYISHAASPAPCGICADLHKLAAQVPELCRRHQACLAAHGELTNHDAANLLVLAMSRVG